MNKEILIGLINPAALPALRIAGGMFLIINLLAGAYIVRHWRRLFGRDLEVEQDTEAVRHLRVEVVLIPWIAMTTVLVLEWLRLWTN
jgi:hypothetical protein